MAMKLHKHGFLDSQALTEEAAGYGGELIEAQVGELSALVDSTLQSTNEIHNDRGLNQKGTADRLFELGVQQRKKLNQLAEQRRGKLDQDLAAGEKELPELSLPPGGSEVFRLQRSMEYAEVRRWLEGMDKAERAAEVQLAAERGDASLILALGLAPEWVRDRLIDPDHFDKARARFLEVTQPEAYAKVATIRSVLSTYDSNVARARNLIATATGTPAGEAALEAVVAASA